MLPVAHCFLPRTSSPRGTLTCLHSYGHSYKFCPVNSTLSGRFLGCQPCVASLPQGLNREHLGVSTLLPIVAKPLETWYNRRRCLGFTTGHIPGICVVRNGIVVLDLQTD